MPLPGRRVRTAVLAVSLLVGTALPTMAAAVEEPVLVVDDMEDGLPSGTDGDGVAIGWNTFQDADSTIAVATVPDSTRPDAEGGNDVLSMTTDVAQFAGVTHSFSDADVTTWEPQDWSAHAGFAVWVDGQGTGTGMFIDVLDNRTAGSTTDDAERWSVSFVDDFTGWRLLEWTWDEFARKSIGNGAPDDGLNLTAVHGWAIGAISTDGEATWKVDDAQVWGERPLGVSFSSPIIPVAEDAGSIAVGLELTRPAEGAVVVEVATSDSTDRTSSEDLIATPDRDYTPSGATVRIEPGQTRAELVVPLLDDDVWEVDETFQVVMEDVSGAPDPGPAGRTSVSIVDDEERDPLLLESFEEEHSPALLDTAADATIAVREIAAADVDALPVQDQFEQVLDVAGPGSAGHRLAIGEDWTASDGIQLWIDGTGTGEELTIRVLDDGAPDPGPDGWELAWSDEFDGPAGARANAADWTYETGGWGWGNQELQYYSDSTDNAALDGDGHLVITAREVDDPEAAGLPCWYGDCTHTSARLVTEGKQEFAYGRLEASVKTADGTGIWPAFWSLGNDFRDVNWPQTGEIDMMEYVGRIPGEIFGTIHGPGYSGGQSFSSGQVPVSPAPPEDFLEYAVVWQPGLITWEVTDGVGTRQYHEAIPADVAPNEWVFEHPFFLLLNVALGGNFGGPLGDDLDLPQETLVDWVRVWQAPDTSERFEATITDDVEGWRQVTIPWEAFTRSVDQPTGAPEDGLTLTAARGWELVVPDDATRSIDRLALAEAPCSPATTVTSAADDGAGSLRRALVSTCSRGTITVDPTLADMTVALDGELVVAQDVVVDASNAPGFTVSGSNASRVLRVEPEATVELHEVALVDGAGAGRGGAVLNSGDLTIVDGLVADSVETDPGDPAFDAGGGGIFTTDGARLHLLRTTVADNATRSHPGGGLHAMFGATVLVEDSTISGNVAADVAGGIRMLGNLTMVDSTVSGNTSTAWNGGGIFATDGTVDLTNVTIVDNVAPTGTAAGLFVATFGTSATVSATNTIIAGNTDGGATDCGLFFGSGEPIAIVSVGGNLDSDGTCPLDQPTDQSLVDPLLGPLAQNGGPTQSHLPADDSPARDAGVAACDEADQRGVARDDGSCDVGSVEVVPSPDTTAPTITVTGVDDGATIGSSEVIDVVASATDDDSGLDRLEVSLDGAVLHDGGSPHQFSLSGSDVELGQHLLRVVAVDVAGNRAEVEVGVTIVTSPGDVLSLVAGLVEDGIVTPREARGVTRHVEIAQRHLDAGRERAAEAQVARAIAQAERIADPDARALLLRDLRALLDDLG